MHGPDTLGRLWHDGRVQTALTGKLLVAAHHLMDPNFYRTVVLVLTHEPDDGAMGLVLNRETGEAVADHLDDWGDLASPQGMVLYGGPVEPDMAVGLARSSGDREAIVPGLCLVDLTAPPDPDITAVRVYSGYSGWAPGQLEEEIGTGTWFVVDAAPDDPFAEADTLWQRVLRRQSGILAMISTFPEDPTLN